MPLTCKKEQMLLFKYGTRLEQKTLVQQPCLLNIVQMFHAGTILLKLDVIKADHTSHLAVRQNPTDLEDVNGADFIAASQQHSPCTQINKGEEMRASNEQVVVVSLQIWWENITQDVRPFTWRNFCVQVNQDEYQSRVCSNGYTYNTTNLTPVIATNHWNSLEPSCLHGHNSPSVVWSWVSNFDSGMRYLDHPSGWASIGLKLEVLTALQLASFWEANKNVSVLALKRGGNTYNASVKITPWINC